MREKKPLPKLDAVNWSVIGVVALNTIVLAVLKIIGFVALPWWLVFVPLMALTIPVVPIIVPVIVISLTNALFRRWRSD